MQVGINDHNLEDFDIPTNDIYCQEFFYYAYSVLNKDRKNFIESNEGYTYMKQSSEFR